MERFVMSLAICSATMTAAAFLFMLILKPLRKIQSAKWRYYSWVLIFLGFLVPFKPSMGGAAINLDAHSSTVSVRMADRFYSVDTSLSDINSSHIFKAAFIIWAVGAAVYLLTVVTRQIMFNRSIRQFSSPVSDKVNAMIEDISDELMIWERITAVTVRGISSPMTVGFFKPIVIIPKKSFSDSELRLILKHELVHFKRRDLFVKAFMIFVVSIHWFNPFIRLFLKKADVECELYCDETVMRGKGEEEKRLYCHAILNSAAQTDQGQGTAVFSPAVSSKFFSGKAGMKHRMKMILSDNKKHGLGLICTAAALMIMSLSGSMLAFSGYDNGFFDDGLVTDTSTVQGSTIGASSVHEADFTIVAAS